MKNKTLAIFGIGTYILSVFASAENLSGESTVPPALIIVSGIAMTVFIIVATIRLWKKSKIASVLLASSSVIYFGLTILHVVFNPAYGSPLILSMNIAKVINFVMFIWTIYTFWKGDFVSYDSSLRNNQTPLIGKDIAWTEIVGQVFRVIEFDKNETIINDKGEVKAKSSFTPYGYLTVESPILNLSAILPIVHKTDFYLAFTAYHNIELEKIISGNDLLVTYVPKRKLPGGLAGVTHALHYLITSKGTLDKYYVDDSQITNPNPEKLFGSFVYEGEVQVEVNLNPKLQNDV